MADIKIWSKKIMEDKVFAEGYKGLKSVKEILNKAKKDGYNITEAEIKNSNVLEGVAGGVLPGMEALEGVIPEENKGSGNRSMMGSGVAGDINGRVDIGVTTQKGSIAVSASGSGQAGNSGGIHFSTGK